MSVKKQESNQEPNKRGFFTRIRSNFLTGIIFVVPIFVTIYFVWWAINFIDNKAQPFIPERFDPNVIWNIQEKLGFQIPGVGVIFFIIFTTIVGSLTKGLFGRTITGWISSAINQFPGVRSIYGALKQIIETIFANRENSFQHACLIEYPRKGVYAVGFISKSADGEVVNKSGKSLYAVFIPTTPNPTSGFLLYFPQDEVQILDMSTEEAAKLIISAGLVEPEHLIK